MGVEPFLIVSTAKTIIAQRLVRRLTNTKEQYFLSDTEYKALEKIVDMDRMMDFLIAEKIMKKGAKWKDVAFYKQKKSEESDDGFKGRIGIHEVLKVSTAVKEIILRSGTSDEIETQAKAEGMMTMLEDGIFQAVQGKTTLEEVLRVVSE